jgi:Xaa-Pro aminopeptidase
MPATLKRMARLRRVLEENSLDAFIIQSIKNARYLTDFTGSAAVLIVEADEASLFVDRHAAEMAQAQVAVANVQVAQRPLLDHAIHQMRRPPTRIGYEAHQLTMLEYEGLRALLPDSSLIGLSNEVERLRAVKDKGEIDLIKQAIKISDNVFDSFCGWIQPGMIEDEVAARLEYEQRMAGGDRKAVSTIVASGERSALSHGFASRRVIRVNEPVMLDIGAVVGGYTSDLTRTVHLGKAPAAFKEIYQTVYHAQQRALEGIKPGITCQAADALAREVIVRAGYGHAFEHGLGHSIGLESELPILSPRDDTTLLQENMVLTVEPGIYLLGRAGVRIEDVVRVTTHGCETLTHSERYLREL